jgi:hypothetical protein
VRVRLSASEQGTCVCFLIAAQIPSRPPIKLGPRPAKLAQSVLSRTTKTLPSCTPVENQSKRVSFSAVAKTFAPDRQVFRADQASKRGVRFFWLLFLPISHHHAVCFSRQAPFPLCGLTGCVHSHFIL